jgi:putative ABC transport system permease protein
MIRLVAADLLAGTRIWIGGLAVAAAAAFVAAFAGGLIETGNVHGGRVREALESSSSAVLIFTAVAALVVLSSTGHLAVTLQRRSHALWQLVGVPPAVVGVVVAAQLLTIGILGALIGCGIALVLFAPLYRIVFRVWDDGMADIALHLTTASVGWVVLAVAATALLGGLRGVHSAVRVRAIEALREPEPSGMRVGWLRVVVFAGTSAGAAGLAASMDGASLSGLSSQAMFLTPLLSGAVAAAGPVVYPLAMRAWTAIVPLRAAASWFLARHTAAHRAAQSSAAIGPLMVAASLAAGLYSTGATLGASQEQRTGDGGGFDIPFEAAMLLLGGPLLVSAVGAAATVLMSGHARERELALVRATGSTGPAAVLAAVWEAVVYAVTAALLALGVTTVGGWLLARALGLAAPMISFVSVGVVAGCGFALLLAATVLPTITALRRPIPRVLAVE